MKMSIEGYESLGKCCNCDETTEVLVVKTKEFTAPHCPMCPLKEVRKRVKPKEVHRD